MPETSDRVSFTDEEHEKARKEELTTLLGKKPSVKKLDEFNEIYSGPVAIHEAYDRASMIGETVERFISSHGSVLLDPVAYKMSRDAATSLFNLYQYLADKEDEVLEEKKSEKT